MKIIIISMLLCLSFIPSSILRAQDSLLIIDAWVLEAPPGMKVMAAYLTLKNNSDNDHVLTGVSSDQFKRVEMHRTVIENELARMEKQHTITVKSGETLKFEPGGSHLMLINPKNILKSEDEIDLSLILANGNIFHVTAQIRKYSEMQSMVRHP